MMTGRHERERSASVYTKRTLAFYDGWVLGFSNRCVWRCRTEHLFELYRRHLSDNHLEAGPGTGRLLAETLPRLPGPVRRFALVDINPDCLEHASAELAAHGPERHLANLLQPLGLPGPRFASIALNYVLHCLPGSLEEKSGKVFDHLLDHLEDDGVLFGSTLLGKDLQLPLAAKTLMAAYNRMGVFDNGEDSLGGLMESLSQRFRTFHVEVRGCGVLSSSVVRMGVPPPPDNPMPSSSNRRTSPRCRLGSERLSIAVPSLEEMLYAWNNSFLAENEIEPRHR